LTWVERNFGYAVARAYAGHTDGGSEAGATATYVRASLAEVAAALAALTSEPHPLVTTKGGDRHGCCHHRRLPCRGPGPGWSGPGTDRNTGARKDSSRGAWRAGSEADQMGVVCEPPGCQPY
jgi:hypothetical protein